MIKLSSLFINGLFLCLVFFHLSCNNTSSDPLNNDPVLKNITSSPTKGGNLIILESESFKNIFPFNIEEEVGYKIICQIHNGLLKLNTSNLKIEPCIAKSWSVNDEQTKYTFHLRNNVYFHKDTCFKDLNTSKLTAQDVKFSFQLLCKEFYKSEYFILTQNIVGANDYYSEKSKDIEGIKVIDDTTIVFELHEAAPSIIYLFASARSSIISQLAFENYGENTTVGTGPFIYKGMNANNDQIILTKNNRYFLKDENGLSYPYLDSVSFFINKYNLNADSLFINDKIMLLQDVTEKKVEELFEDYHQEFDDKKYLVNRESVLATNCYEFNTSLAPFNNVKVRQAFSYAINKKSILETILNGQGKIGNKGIVPVINSFETYNYDNINGYEYNPKKAKDLLKDAGYPNGTGFPEVILELNFGHPTNLEVAKEIQNQLKSILNVSITIEQESLYNLIDRAAMGKSQMNHFTWLSEYPSPADFLNVFYGGNNPTSQSEYHWPNTSRYYNNEYDKIYEKALVTSDQVEQFKLFNKAENILMTDAPIIVLWYPEVYNLVHEYVKDLHFNEMLHFDYSLVYLKR